MQTKQRVRNFDKSMYSFVRQGTTGSLLNFSVNGRDIALPYSYITTLTFSYLKNGSERVHIRFGKLGVVDIWGLGLREVHKYIIDRIIRSIQPGYNEDTEISTIDVKIT